MKLQNYKITKSHKFHSKYLLLFPLFPLDQHTFHSNNWRSRLRTTSIPRTSYIPFRFHSNTTKFEQFPTNFGFIFHLIPQNTTRRGNWAGRGTAISNTRWRTNAQLFPLKILTFQDRFSDSSLIPFPPISNNKYSLFTSNILIFKHKYSERQIFTFCHIFNQYYSLFQNNFKQMPTFVPISPILYNKYSHFASVLHILGAKAKIFHQHHFFHKQTLFFPLSQLNTAQNYSNYPNYPNYPNSQITTQISRFLQNPSTSM